MYFEDSPFGSLSTTWWARTLRGATVTDAQQWKAATVACLQDRA